MVTPDRIVVGLAEDGAAGRTLAWALREATATARPIVIVRAAVTRVAVLGAVVRGGGPELDSADPALGRAVAAARSVLGEDRVSIVVERDPAGAVLTAVARAGDLLVVGPPSRPGWWQRASTTSHVITHGRVPVAVVHRSAPRTQAPDVGRVFGSHVAVGVDGSRASQEAIGFGFAYAAQHRLPLAAVNVAERAPDDVWFDDKMLETHLGVEPTVAEMLSAEVEPWSSSTPPCRSSGPSSRAVQRLACAGPPPARRCS